MAQVEHAGVLDRGPPGLGCFIAVRPIRGQTMVAARVYEFESAAAASRPLAPAATRSVSQVIHGDVDRVRLRQPAAVDGNGGFGQGQGKPFAVVRKLAAEIAERVVRVEVRLSD